MSQKIPSKRELLKVIAHLRGLVAVSVMDATPVERSEAFGDLNKELFGSGLPHFNDDQVDWSEWE